MQMHKEHIIEVGNGLKIISRKKQGAQQEILNSLSSDWENENQKRHDFIMRYNEFETLPANYKDALRITRDEVAKKLSIPTNKQHNNNNKYITDFQYYYNIADGKKIDKFNSALKAVKNSIDSNYVSNLYNQNNLISGSINNAYNSIMNPYEAQILFETTSLGYQGVVIPIKEGFSTTLSVASPFLGSEDLKGVKNYLIKKEVMGTIKTAIIDSYVFGGGIITPILNIKGEPQYLGDLIEKERYFGIEGLKLDRLICFDRYCTIPALSNDGLFTLKLRSNLPVELKTIFDNSILMQEWHAIFKPLTTSLSKLYRPDNFGVSIFCRAGKAVYNYEQQLQFLNFALGQLSIIVFNSKSQMFENGGSADHTWDSSLGGKNIEEIRAQLSAMQNQMNIERGLYLNDIEVSTINRTFTGIGDIIKAMKEQASNAFDIKQDLLFGDVKSGLGNQTNEMATPMQLKYREQFREPITKTLKWCVFTYFAERNFTRQTEDGIQKWSKESFFEMIDSIELVYNDSIKTKEMVLKESGANEILRLVEGKLISLSDGIRYISEIPDIAKILNNGDKNREEWMQSVINLSIQNVKAGITELKAMEKINQAIIDKPDPLAPKTQEVDIRLKPLSDLGKEDENGIIQPLKTEDKKVDREKSQSELRTLKHEQK